VIVTAAFMFAGLAFGCGWYWSQYRWAKRNHIRINGTNYRVARRGPSYRPFDSGRDE